MPLVTCSCWGQVVQKKNLTTSDYDLWSDSHLDKISFDGKWASYITTYQNEVDTLFVKEIDTQKKFNFAGGYNSRFSKKKVFICQSGRDLKILNLISGEQETISAVIQFEYCQETDQLIYLVTSENQKNTLVVRNFINGKSIIFNDVSRFSLSPNGHQLLYCSSTLKVNSILLVNLKETYKSKFILTNSENEFNSFTWQKDGHSLAFIAYNPDLLIDGLFYYSIEKDHLEKLDPEKDPDFPSNYRIKYDSFFNLKISDDSQKVLLYIAPSNFESTQKNKNVEIWNANDKWILSQDKQRGNFEGKPIIACWEPIRKTFFRITSAILPYVMFTGDFKYAVLSNPKEYEPQFEDEGPRDYYLMNLHTFQKKLFIKRQSSFRGEIIPSPSGKYIAYFKDNNWWVYNISNNTHQNVTRLINGKFTATENLLGSESACGSPGWSKDDKEILIYDEFDIWAINPSEGSFRRLTHGRELKIRFRIADPPDQKGIKYSYNGPTSSLFDFNNKLVLKAQGEDYKTGYFTLEKNSEEKSIVFENNFVDEINYNSDKTVFFYREQNYNMSPCLIMKNRTKQISFFSSNKHQQKYYWGSSELIHYKNSKGQNLKGALFYPANYDPEKKYPMIVNIYEIKSKELNTYVNPTLLNENGFNSTIFTTNGYFVFMPDILHENGNPGISAVDCVVSGTKKVIEKKNIDSGKIGLAGHSFGGYEVSFIITQTNIFSAAIASGAITDLISFYHTVSQNSGKPDMWRFNNEQWRMKKSPYEIPESYIANSPIMHVDKINTPVLLWTGKQDKIVDTHQSFEYYLALRRLQKKCILIQYPDENHLLLNSLNQKDATLRMLDWFNHFLKQESSISWIENGTR
ncbi:prolyl oligopeptidase family serine peptidase [Flavobacterium sp. HJSW_4]|uniref:S9 family peptidase n=1 Tax=Flavobacterium sp. HJSW_4 TaxID=3344660 RepID=UPI0035F31C38